MKSKKGLSTGTVFLIVGLLVLAYVTNFAGVQDLISPEVEDVVTTDDCPSSGLTEVTINAQEALASSATNANVSYYFYKDGALVSNGDTGTDGTIAVDIGCGDTYDLLVLNEQTETGYYPQRAQIVADRATVTKSFKMYEYGSFNLASVVSSTDPAGDDNISVGTGKTCGFTITFSSNESASAVNKPLIICMANKTAVDELTLNGVTVATSKRPDRITTPSTQKLWIWEYNELLKSTDGAVKLNGQIKFDSTYTIATQVKNNISCTLVDQATYRVAEWQTLGIGTGFVESAENLESLANIGALDSNRRTLEFGGTYC